MPTPPRARATALMLCLVMAVARDHPAQGGRVRRAARWRPVSAGRLCTSPGPTASRTWSGTSPAPTTTTTACASRSPRRPGSPSPVRPGSATSSTVRAYPYIGTGCFAGACAGPAKPRARCPRPAHSGTTPSQWATKTPKRSGVWNSSLDLWLGSVQRNGHHGDDDLAAVQQAVLVGKAVSRRSRWTARNGTWYRTPRCPVSSTSRSAGPRVTHQAKLRLAPFMTIAAAARRAQLVRAAVERPGGLRNLVGRAWPGRHPLLRQPVKRGVAGC